MLPSYTRDSELVAGSNMQDEQQVWAPLGKCFPGHRFVVETSFIFSSSHDSDLYQTPLQVLGCC